MDQEHRNLTDEDIRALADEMEQRLVDRFYSNVGRGVWGMVWRVVIVVLMGLASYGAWRGFKW